MYYFAAGVLGLILFYSFAQAIVVAVYVRKLRSVRRDMDSPDDLPKAAVIVSVRGPDPFLKTTLNGLLQQDYPDFRIFVVVDHPQDPALPIVEQVQQLAPEIVEVKILQHPRTTCSLKCSSLAEVVDNLDPSFKIVAFIDGDAPPHPQWLQDLATPLADPIVGVTTGNRWYMPSEGGMGSLVRYFWNAGAIVQVWLNGIVWAGSMAMRTDVMKQIGLTSAWRRALSVDGTVCRQLRQHGYRVQFVPAVMMVNREEIPLRQFMPWVGRQMVAAKSSGSGWHIVMLHAFNLVVCLVVPVATWIASTLQGNFEATCLAAIATICYWMTAMHSTLAIEGGVRHVVEQNEVHSRWFTFRVLLLFLPAIVLTHFVYLATLYDAYFRRRISWRGIVYEIRGINNICMLEYRPYQSNAICRPVESII